VGERWCILALKYYFWWADNISISKTLECVLCLSEMQVCFSLFRGRTLHMLS